MPEETSQNSGSTDSGNGDYSLGDFMNDAPNIPAPEEATPNADNQLQTDEVGNVVNADIDGGTGIDVPPVTTPAATPVAKPSRDMTGIDPEDVDLFRQMSNQAFAKLKPVYLANKQREQEMADLKSKLDEASNLRWYDHENAWQLHPEVSHLQNNIQNLDFEINFWKDQLQNIEEGKPFQKLVGFNEDGSYRVSEPIEPNIKDKIELLGKVQQGFTLKTGQMEKLQSLQGSFKGSHQSLMGTLSQIDKNIFGKIDWKANDEMFKQALSQFPPVYHNRPEIQMLAKAGVVMQLLVNRLQQAEGRQKKVNIVRNTARSSGPVAENQAGTATTSTGGVSDWDRFARLTGGV